jgi:hypothetical protein
LKYHLWYWHVLANLTAQFKVRGTFSALTLHAAVVLHNSGSLFPKLDYVFFSHSVSLALLTQRSKLIMIRVVQVVSGLGGRVMKSFVMFLVVLLFSAPCYGQIVFGGRSSRQPLADLRANQYDPNSLSNRYGAGSPYKTDGLMNPYSPYGSRYSNQSWRNPYATNAPKIYGSDGTYHGRLSANRYDPDSTSNRFGRYGSPYSPDSINNRYGLGSPYRIAPIYVYPSKW